MADISSDPSERVHYFPPQKTKDTSGEDFISRLPDYLTALKAAIFIQHQCYPIYKDTVIVREKAKGHKIFWKGPVSIFDITGHEKARTCYAWVHADTKGRAKIFAVLGSRLVESPNKAVRAAIFADALPVRKYSNALELLRKQMQISKKLVQTAQVKSEDLDAAICAAKDIYENIRQNLNPPFPPPTLGDRPRGDGAETVR